MAATAAAADQFAGSATQSGSKLRYPLRSAGRPRDDKQPAAAEAAADRSRSSAGKRGRQSSAVSKSMSVLDPSAKLLRSSRPLKRLSVPPKVVTPASLQQQSGPNGSITPLLENTSKKSNAQVKSETPLSDISKSALRRKFSVLSSVSYWLSQIKLSESASKHSISLGFFKLAVESGCEPQERVREELKAYALKHNLLAEVGEPAKDLLQTCGVLEDLERRLQQLSESCNRQHGGDGPKNNDISPTAVARTGRLKPRALNSETPKAGETTIKETAKKPLPAAAKTRVGVKDATANVQRKTNKVNKLGADRSRRAVMKGSAEKVNEPSVVTDEIPEENKENLETHLPEEGNITEDIQAR